MTGYSKSCAAPPVETRPSTLRLMKEDELALDPCPACCSTCTTSFPAQLTGDSHYGSANMLPAGTIEFMVTTRHFCDHLHADDGWHPFRGDLVLPHLTHASDSSICDELEYLIKHKYILASYRHHVAVLLIYVRIYIIPYDLPNVDGKLLLRPENIAKPARLYLKRLLPTIDKNSDKWAGRSSSPCLSTSPIEPFLYSKPVRFLVPFILHFYHLRRQSIDTGRPDDGRNI